MNARLGGTFARGLGLDPAPRQVAASGERTLACPKRLRKEVMTDPQTPEELRPVIEELQAGPLDEDASADFAEAEEGDYIDADELMSLLKSMQGLLEEQSKEIRGLRREMRELREGLGGRGASERGERPSREGGYQNREGQGRDFRSREGGWSPYNRDRGERGGDREFRPREGGYRGGDRDRGDRGSDRGEGGFRPRGQGGFRDRNEGGGFRPREGGSGDFRSREFRPREGGDQGGGEYRPRPRRDHGWGGKKRDE